MDTQDIGIFFSEYWQLFAMIGIMIIPTIVHIAMTKSGYISPHFIRTLAINTWVKGIVGIILGVIIGMAINKKVQ